MTSQWLASRKADGFVGFVSSIGSRLDSSPLIVMLDIDGTLAPIAPRPDDAVIPARTRNVLRKLVAIRGVVVAAITGRSAAVGGRLVDVDGTWVVGNHGIELLTPDGTLTASAEAREHEHSVAEAARQLAALERAVPGAIVENKRWSLSLHYRLADPKSVPALIQRANDVALALSLRVTEGKKIVELRPPVREDKGTAAMALAERFGVTEGRGSLFLAGDDQTDEDAFRALRGRDPRAVTVRILANEADPAPISTEAEFVLASPDELREVLEWLAARRLRG